MKKIIILILSLLVLIGCASQQDLEDLEAENQRLRKALENPSIVHSINDTFDARITILEKLDVDEKYGWVIGQIGDVDHNTPVLFVVDRVLFEQIEVGDEDNYHIYVRVNELLDSDTKYRYEFMILDILA